MVALFRALAIWALSAAFFVVLPAYAQPGITVEQCVDDLMWFAVEDDGPAAKTDQKDRTAAGHLCRAFADPGTRFGDFRVKVRHGEILLEILKENSGLDHPQLSGALLAEILQSEFFLALLPDTLGTSPIHTLTIDGGIIEGTIQFRRSKIDRTVNLQNCTLVLPTNGASLKIIASDFAGSFRFEDCSYSGSITILGARIERNLVIETNDANKVAHRTLTPPSNHDQAHSRNLLAIESYIGGNFIIRNSGFDMHPPEKCDDSFRELRIQYTTVLGTSDFRRFCTSGVLRIWTSRLADLLMVDFWSSDGIQINSSTFSSVWLNLHRHSDIIIDNNLVALDFKLESGGESEGQSANERRTIKGTQNPPPNLHISSNQFGGLVQIYLDCIQDQCVERFLLKYNGFQDSLWLGFAQHAAITLDLTGNRLEAALALYAKAIDGACETSTDSHLVLDNVSTGAFYWAPDVLACFVPDKGLSGGASDWKGSLSIDRLRFEFFDRSLAENKILPGPFRPETAGAVVHEKDEERESDLPKDWRTELATHLANMPDERERVSGKPDVLQHLSYLTQAVNPDLARNLGATSKCIVYGGLGCSERYLGNNENVPFRTWITRWASAKGESVLRSILSVSHFGERRYLVLVWAGFVFIIFTAIYFVYSWREQVKRSSWSEFVIEIRKYLSELFRAGKSTKSEGSSLGNDNWSTNHVGFERHEGSRAPADFSLLIYSLDVMVPFIDLQCYSAYYPKAAWMRLLVAFQHFAGWALLAIVGTSLLV